MDTIGRKCATPTLRGNRFAAHAEASTLPRPRNRSTTLRPLKKVGLVWIATIASLSAGIATTRNAATSRLAALATIPTATSPITFRALAECDAWPDSPQTPA